MDIRKIKLPLSKRGEPEIFLESLTIGEGRPKTFLLSGVHGNENTGQLIINEFLKKIPQFSGTLTILPIANPTGFKKNVREEPVSGLDLNREFFDSKNDTLPSVIVQAIINFAKQHDYVIDLHNFSTQGLIQAVSNHNGQSDYLATLFNPDVIRVAPKEIELKKNGTLGQYLKEIGIPYILIEMPTHEKIVQEQIERIVSGIIKHLDQCTEYDELKKNTFNRIPSVVIKKVKAESGGFFKKEKELSLGDKVVKDQVLGTIRDFSNAAISTIYSPWTGIICEMDDDEEHQVTANEILLRIGETTQESR